MKLSRTFFVKQASGNYISVTIVFERGYYLSEVFFMNLRLLSTLAMIATMGLLLVIASPTAVFAESNDCSAPVIIIPDGRLSLSTFAQNALYWYGVYAVAGHSYSVEFESASENTSTTTKVVFSPISVFAPSDSLVGCRGASTVNLTQTEAYSPAIRRSPNVAGRRVSFTAQAAGLYLLAASNVGTSGSYSFSVVDTTMVNTRWSSCSGYYTQWGLVDVSDMTITGVFTVYDYTGRALAQRTLTLAPGTAQYRISPANDMNVIPNSFGYATFVHNGPPDAVIGDAFIVSGNGAVIYAARFERPGGR